MNPDDFASQYPRNEDGWIQFPDDSVLRKSYFPPEVMGHPAKANLYMVQALVEHVSEPGERIVDPMSGTGSILIAALLGRKVVCIEIEEGYHQLQRKALEVFEVLNPEVAGSVVLLHGDCRRMLPLPCDHIIFSPPYSTILKFKAERESTKALTGSSYQDTMQDYSASPNNVGRLGKFFYNQAMEKVYTQCFASLRPGGTMSVIIQDYYGQEYGRRTRIRLSEWLLKVCIRMGFEQDGWYKRAATGTGFKKLWIKRGYDVVGDEDIIVMRRPA